MVYTDYYDYYEFARAFKDIEKIDDLGVDLFYGLDTLSKGKYKINKDGYLYFILGKSIIYHFDRSCLNYLNNHPYVLDYDFKSSIKKMNTTLGSVRFSLCVDDVKNVCMFGDKQVFDILSGVILGKYWDRSHEIVYLLGENFDSIITAFVNSPLDGYKYLHSFGVRDKFVYDLAYNLKMNKNDYYNLISPDIISSVKGSELAIDFERSSHYYPLMSIRDFLVRYNELVYKKM